jgi:hypothetical protein
MEEYMSITFWAPDAPTESYVPYPDDEPDYVEQRSLLPEINLSNVNAYAMMRALGVEPDYAGTWSVGELAVLLERAVKLANIEVLRDPFLKDTTTTGGQLRPSAVSGNVVSVSRGCRVIDNGRDDAYIREKALRFVDLFKKARENGFSVSWG